MPSPSLVQTIGTLALTTSAGAVTVTTATVAGHTILVRCADTNLTSVPAVTDSAGNTYVQIATSVAAGAPRTTLFASIAATAIPHSGTITVTPGSGEEIAVVAEEWSGITGIDQFVETNALSGTSLAAAGFTTLQANETIYAASSTLDLRTFTGDAGYSTLTQANNGQASPNETTTYGQYEAVASAGAQSGYSASVNSSVASSVVVLSFISGVPFAPSAPVAVVLDLPLEITITWIAPSGFSASSQEVQRSSDGLTWQTLTTLGGSATVYTDTTVLSQTPYYYRIVAVNSAGSTDSPPSLQVVTPAQPLLLGYTLTYTPMAVSLSWQSLSGGTGYVPERSTSPVPSSFTPLPLPGGIASQTATTFVDTTIVAGTLYYYRVQGTSPAGTFYSPIVGLYAPGPAAPAAPQLAIDPYFQGSVTLWWQPVVSMRPPVYAVQRSPHNANTWTVLASGIYGGTYSDEGVPSAGTWDYQVTVTDAPPGSIITGRTNTGAIGTITVPVLPTAAPSLISSPGSLAATAVASPSSGATSYTLQRSSDQTRTWTTVQSGLSTPSATDTGLAAYTRYWYRYVASDGSGHSANGPPRSIFLDGNSSPPSRGLRFIINHADVSALTTLVEPQLDRQVGNQGATSRLRVHFEPTTSNPSTLAWPQEVQIYDGPQLIFTGWIDDVTRHSLSPSAEEDDLVAADAAVMVANNSYVTECFEQQTAGWVVQCLIARYLPGLSTAGVQAGPVVPYVALQTQTLLSAIRRLLGLGAASAQSPYFLFTPDLDCVLAFGGTLPQAPFLLSDANPITRGYP